MRFASWSAPGTKGLTAPPRGAHAGRIRFVEQAAALGYGHAVQCARGFTGEAPFLLLVGDHLYVSRAEKNCAQQLVEAARAESCAVSAVQATHESKLPFYGAVGGHLVPGTPAPLPNRARPGKTHADGGGTEVDRAGIEGGALPVFFRNARIDARGHAPPQ